MSVRKLLMLPQQVDYHRALCKHKWVLSWTTSVFTHELSALLPRGEKPFIFVSIVFPEPDSAGVHISVC